ncbi:hypothetical protein AERO9A_210085 [Aeromonas salmonicida]|nr:hypothetical protein AERO9A_210085 [Aeromonas salmonicida]
MDCPFQCPPASHTGLYLPLVPYHFDLWAGGVITTGSTGLMAEKAMFPYIFCTPTGENPWRASAKTGCFCCFFYRCCWPVLRRLQRKAGISDKPPRRSLP